MFYDLGGETFTLLHRYADAVTAYDRALTPRARHASRRSIAARLPTSSGKGASSRCATILSHLPEGADARRRRQRGGASVPRWLLLERDAAGLLQLPEVGRATDFEASTFFLPSELYRGWAHQMRGDPASAREAFSAAVTRLDARGS